jgi:uncharacterized protein
MSLPAPAADSAVLVTGASSGIGAELARQLAALGHGLVIVARRRERLDELAAELRAAHGVRVDIHDADLADPASRAALVDAVRAAGINVAAVCNNAGYGSYGRFAELDFANEAREVQVNVNALHELTHAFLHPMLERHAGAILNVSSIAGFQPLPNMATYSATKAFVTTFSEALHTELRGTGVSCTVLCPGPVATEFGQVAGTAEMDAELPGVAYADVEDVAREAIRAMRRGKRTVVPGLAARLLATGGRFAPRTLLLPAARMVGGRRR